MDTLQNSTVSPEIELAANESLQQNNDVSTIKRVLGNIESFEQGYISGWIHDTEDSSRRVEFDVFENNTKIASGIADKERVDLFQNDLGDGCYGFTLRLDDSILDGRNHTLHIVDSLTGQIVGPHTVAAEVYSSSTISKIEFGIVKGEIVLTDTANMAGTTAITGYDMEILCDGQVCALGNCVYNEQTASYQFSIQLPSYLYDDCYHVYSAQLKWLSTKAALHQEKLCSILTPWEHISNDADHGIMSSVSKVAGFRYKSLQSQISQLANSDNASAQLNNLMLSHSVVVQGYENRKEYPFLELPEFTDPVVSIIIPAHNKFELTYHCIASIILAGNKTPFEVIVVDDQSTDKTVDIIRYCKNVRVVRNETNKGFLRSSNAGADKARGDYLLFLNNDTEVTDSWLDALMDVFARFTNVGIVGSKLIYPTGTLQDAGGLIWGNGKPWNYGHQQNAADPKFNYVRQVDYLSGAALIISRTVWNLVESFSDEFAPAYYEDVDLAFKVREAGYKTYYCPLSTVIHFEGMSNGKEVTGGIKKHQLVNAPRFRSKWRHYYRHNGIEAQNADFQKDRNIDFRVLLVDCTTPKSDHDAGGYAASQEMKLMQELGCKVTFAPNNMAHMGKYTYELQNNGVECVYAPFFASVGDLLKSRGMEFDLIYIIRYDIAEELMPYINEFTRAKVILNNCDLHFLREIRAALVANDADLQGPINTRERELAVMEQVDAVLSYNDVEHSVITSHSLSDENIFNCPWVLEPKLSNTPFHDRKDIAFLGGFNHTPNIEAIHYFVDLVMPLLKEKMPDVKLRVYGSRVTPEIQALECENVIIEGFVESLSTVFDSCRVFVAPLLSGAGIKGKVLESIAYGVPSVLSPVAIESTGLIDGTSALVAHTDQDWVTNIERLYNDETLWNNMSKSSHSLVSTQYSFENGLNEMAKVFEYLELDPALALQRIFKAA